MKSKSSSKPDSSYLHRAHTIATRLKIGFEKKSKWKSAHAIFNKHTLTILGHPVMEDWETPYMRMLASLASLNGGRILELGYGMGISSRFVQQHNISEHIIIEANHEVAEKARQFAKKAQHKAIIIEGFWEDMIDSVKPESIDGILFDTYPLNENELHKNHFLFFPHAHRILKREGVFTYYSDEVSNFSKEHKQKLLSAGFTNHTNMQGILVKVNPPQNCLYWVHKTIFAPIIQK